jgi:AcrR family transcriptional regulator
MSSPRITSRAGAAAPPTFDERPERLRNGRTLAERRQERREALLDSALELFGTKGYASTSVEEICRNAFVSTRNFYEEFDNRDAVLQELGDRLVTDAYRAMIAVETRPGADRLRTEATARVDALVHSLLDDPRKARIAFIETLGVSPQQEARRRVAHQLFARYFVGLAGAGEDHVPARPGPDGAGADAGALHDSGAYGREVFSLALVGAVNEVLSDWVLRDDKVPLDELTRSIVEIIVLMSSTVRPATEP